MSLVKARNSRRKKWAKVTDTSKVLRYKKTGKDEYLFAGKSHSKQLWYSPNIGKRRTKKQMNKAMINYMRKH